MGKQRERYLGRNDEEHSTRTEGVERIMLSIENPWLRTPGLHGLGKINK
jgi:hypothetical protein